MQLGANQFKIILNKLITEIVENLPMSEVLNNK